MNRMNSSPRHSRLTAFFQTQKGKQASLWLAFFIFWAGSAAVIPYIGVYLESVRIPGRQIGQLTSIPYFVALISSVVFGFLSDVSKRNKLLFRICTIGLIAVLFVYPRARTYSALFPVVLLYSILHAPVNPILDQTSLAALENPGLYGKLRVGGSIGWGIMALVTGFLIDNLGLGISVIFYLNIFFMALFFFLTAFLPEPELPEQAQGENVSLKKLGKMLLQPGFLLLFLLIIIWGIGESSIQNFLFLHIKQLGGSSTLMGTALSISLVGEIVVFSFADKIHSKFGELRMILLAFVVLILWLAMLSLVKNPNLIPLFQIFGGTGFALIQSGSVAYVNRKAPAELGTTAQALRGGVYAGLGGGVGALLSGILYEFSGSTAMYRTMVFVQLGGLVLGVLIAMRERRIRNARQA